MEFEQGYFVGNRKITVDGAKTTERGRPFMVAGLSGLGGSSVRRIARLILQRRP